jgi:hypothetical protein
LRWQKAENYKLESLESTVYRLNEALTKATNILFQLDERLFKLEQKEIDRENLTTTL